MKSKKPGKVTIVDVAKEAQVSHATVSRVLNNIGYIKETTRERVLAAVDKLGYIRNPQARSLTGAPTRLVGLLIADFRGSYIAELADHITRELHNADYDIAIFPTSSAEERERSLIERTTTGFLDGLLIMMLGVPETYISLLDRHGLAYTLIGSEPTEGLGPLVGQTNWQGAYDAVHHLTELGHRKIAILSGPEGRGSAIDRLAGFRAAMGNAGIELRVDYIRVADYQTPDGYRETKLLLDLDDPPTAIFAANDNSAIGAMDAIHNSGLTIPGDISVVGFDDVIEASFVTPRLTTVHAPLDVMGREAVRVLLEQLDNPDTITPARSVTVATRLVIRESTASPIQE